MLCALNIPFQQSKQCRGLLQVKQPLPLPVYLCPDNLQLLFLCRKLPDALCDQVLNSATGSQLNKLCYIYFHLLEISKFFLTFVKNSETQQVLP